MPPALAHRFNLLSFFFVFLWKGKELSALTLWSAKLEVPTSTVRSLETSVGGLAERRVEFRRGAQDPRNEAGTRVSYHSLAWRLMRLGRNVLFPEMLCFSSVTVATPIFSFCLSLSLSLLYSSLSLSPMKSAQQANTAKGCTPNMFTWASGQRTVQLICSTSAF